MQTIRLFRNFYFALFTAKENNLYLHRKQKVSIKKTRHFLIFTNFISWRHRSKLKCWKISLNMRKMSKFPFRKNFCRCFFNVLFFFTSDVFNITFLNVFSNKFQIIYLRLCTFKYNYGEHISMMPYIFFVQPPAD